MRFGKCLILILKEDGGCKLKSYEHSFLKPWESELEADILTAQHKEIRLPPTHSFHD